MDEKDSKDLTKYYAGNSPTKSGDVKKSTVAKRVHGASKSPMRAHNPSDTSPSMGGGTTKSFGSPNKDSTTKFSDAK